MRVGVLALGRTTFDLETAAPVVEAAHRELELTGDVVAGDGRILDDVDDVAAATSGLGALDALILLQATFTDGTLHQAAADPHPDAPIVLWGFPEPRTGGRLLLNSLCGINLAAFTLGRRDLRWLYASPTGDGVQDALRAALHSPVPRGERRTLPAPGADDEACARAVVTALPAMRIGAIGERPDGFDPCDFTDSEVASVGSPVVDRVELTDLFAAARAADAMAVSELEQTVADRLAGVRMLDPDGVEATLRLHLGLRALCTKRNWNTVATRCWPECFTEMGGAACAAQGMLDDIGVPATCERDVFGALTALVLGVMAGSSPFVADLVDVDRDDDTVAVWHCGIAPLAMAHPDEPPEAATHPNRGLPLLHQFRLRPGRVTLARFNRSANGMRLVVGGGEILERPRPFSGTSAVLRPDCGAGTLLEIVMGERLEHHYGIVHGDVQGALVALAGHLGLEVVRL
jgi:hypothetical protein